MNFRLVGINEIREYLLEETKRNQKSSKKHQKIQKVLNYGDYLFLALREIFGCVSNSSFTSVAGAPIGIVHTTIPFKTIPVLAANKKYKINS